MNLPFSAGEGGLIPGWGTEIPYAAGQPESPRATTAEPTAQQKLSRGLSCASTRSLRALQLKRVRALQQRPSTTKKRKGAKWSLSNPLRQVRWTHPFPSRPLSPCLGLAQLDHTFKVLGSGMQTLLRNMDVIAIYCVTSFGASLKTETK